MKINENFAAAIERRKTQNLEFVSVPVQKLFGNIYMEYEGRLLNVGIKDSKYNDFLTALKRYRNNSKNYANIFLTKGKVMVDILNNLIPKYELVIQQSFSFYETQVILNYLV